MMVEGAVKTEEFGPIAIPAREVPAQPYRGIAPFRFIDQPIFFGRIPESRRLLRLVTMYRGVLLYGDSGSGKSSLLNARFVPDALADGFLPERIRVQPKKGAEIVLDRIAMRERGLPPFLPSNLARENEEPRLILSCEQLRELIARPGGQGYPLLLFDQFEEFVTLFEVAPRTAEDRAEAAEAQARLLDLLAEFLVSSQAPVKVLLAFREDYFTKLQKLFLRCRDLMDQSLRLLPPSVDELPLTIRGPFEKNPDVFTNPLPLRVCEQLEMQLRERSSDGFQNPTEVQIAGLVLWQSKTPKELLARRKVEGLLEDYLVQQLEALPAEGRAVAVALLSCLVTDAGTRNIVSDADLLARVSESENVSATLVASTLEALVVKTGLIRQEFREHTAFYQIISEFLVPWIRTQKAERARIEAEEQLASERIAAQQKLELQQAEADRERAEALSHSLRRVRRSRAILAGMLLLLFAVASVALLQRNRANAEKVEADRARATAAREKEAAETAENAARTALEQNARTSASAEKHLLAAAQTLARTQLETSQLIEEMTRMTRAFTPADKSAWNQLIQKFATLAQTAGAGSKQVSAAAASTQQEAARATTVSGWSIYGRLAEDQSWEERYFHHAGSREAIPVVGDIVVSDTFVNVRVRPRIYDAEKQPWSEEQIVGIIAPQQRIRVTEILRVAGEPGDTRARFWIHGEPPAP